MRTDTDKRVAADYGMTRAEFRRDILRHHGKSDFAFYNTARRQTGPLRKLLRGHKPIVGCRTLWDSRPALKPADMKVYTFMKREGRLMKGREEIIVLPTPRERIS